MKKRTRELPASEIPLEEIRNPHGYHCPRCKGDRLYVCDDDSAYCYTCKRGFMDIKKALEAKPANVLRTADSNGEK